MIKKFKSYSKKLGIVLTYLVFILYSLELLSVIFLKKQNNFLEISFEELKNKKIKKIKNFDKRSDYKAFLDERKKQDLSPSFKYSEWHLRNGDYNDKIKNFLQSKINNNKIIPFRGPVNKKSLGDNEDGFREIINNDKYGFKNLNIFYENQIDVMILGDSFAEGVPFDNFNDISGNIRKKSDYNSINYGVSGSGPLLSLGIIKEYAANLKPKNVFYLFYEGNDLNDLMIEKNTFLIKYLKNFDQNLFNNSKDIKIFLSEYEKIFYEILEINITKEKNKDINRNIENTNVNKEKIKNFFELNTLKEIILPSSVFTKSEIDYDLFGSVIDEMNKEVQNWNADFYFVYLPSWIRYNNKYSLANLLFKKKIKKIVNKKNIKFIDIDNIFKIKKFNNTESYNLGLYGHYTKESYSLIAHEFLNILSKN